MYMYMHIYIYVYTYIDIYIYISIYVYVYIYILCYYYYYCYDRCCSAGLVSPKLELPLAASQYPRVPVPSHDNSAYLVCTMSVLVMPSLLLCCCNIVSLRCMRSIVALPCVSSTYWCRFRCVTAGADATHCQARLVTRSYWHHHLWYCTVISPVHACC